MSPSPEIIKKINSLREKIEEADHKYYTLADPDIDDFAYEFFC